MKITILGGGLAALSLCYFLQDRADVESIDVIEKENRPGGLCRSFDLGGGVLYDVGPHIIFSKDKEVLGLMKDLLGENIHELRRSNRIMHKGRLVQYPFENDLSKLPEDDLNYCVNAFMNNPYEGYPADNMLQFLLKTFGEGITNTFLRPYNEKIWKYDPSYMDTQMVERIPKPPKEDILRSAKGETVDGYLHQLYFSYPKRGGIQAIVDGFISRLGDKVRIHTGCAVTGVKKAGTGFSISAGGREFKADRVVSTIPAGLLVRLYDRSPEDVTEAAKALRYNSIVIALADLKVDKAGDNFAFMTADKEVVFHRLSKIDFLGEAYGKGTGANLMVEVTYRHGDLIDGMPDSELLTRITAGLEKTGFIDTPEDINRIVIKRFEYAYVIYDIEHRKNMDRILGYFRSEGLDLNGRFGEFEYLNMDAVIRHSMQLSGRF